MLSMYMPHKWECETCGHISSCQKNHDKHIHQKIPCGQRNFVCECGERFVAKKGLNHHKKHICKGPKQDLQVELDRANQRCEVLRNELRRLEAPAINDEETAVQDAQPPPAIINFVILTVFTTDVQLPQIYFFVAGPALIPLQVPEQGIVIKFGFTDLPYQRMLTHKRDFKGGRLVDSIICVNPKAVEADFKRWMRAIDRLVEAKTENKPTVDGEVFIARDQADYEMIVRKASGFARSLENKITSIKHELQNQTDLLNEILAKHAA